MNGGSEAARVRCAVFLDFDNIFLGLQENFDFQTARAFATAPRQWLAWIESAFAPAEDDGGDAAAGSAGGVATGERSLLIRRCYMNPETFGKYRPDFLNSGFSVVDCPPLTRRGKTSADIYMAVDILETLHHDTRFDEFIILSGDADFTPVLVRLRAHDRRTVVVTIGPTAGPYIGAADRVIGEDEFVESALRIDADRPTGLETPGTELDQVLTAMADRLHQAVREAGEMEIGKVPSVLRIFREFTASRDWLGFRSLRSLTEALLRRQPALSLDAALVLRASGVAPAAPPPPVAPATAAAPRDAAPPAVRDTAPASMDAGAPPLPADVRAFRDRIHQLTSIPLLSSRLYARIFELVGEEVAANGYYLTSTARAVRDRLAAEGDELPRGNVSLVLTAIVYGGNRIGKGETPETPAQLARMFRDNAALLAANAGLELDEEERRMLDDWLLPGVADEPPPDGAGDEEEREDTGPGMDGGELEEEPASLAAEVED